MIREPLADMEARLAAVRTDAAYALRQLLLGKAHPEMIHDTTSRALDVLEHMELELAEPAEPVEMTAEEILRNEG